MIVDPGVLGRTMCKPPVVADAQNVDLSLYGRQRAVPVDPRLMHSPSQGGIVGGCIQSECLLDEKGVRCGWRQGSPMA
jgi:hypothetical protein